MRHTLPKPQTDRQGRGDGTMHHLLAGADVASIVVVLGVLEQQAADLGPTSRIAAVWQDWAGLLSPTADEAIGRL